MFPTISRAQQSAAAAATSCVSFEPQEWIEDQCRRCFCHRDQHGPTHGQCKGSAPMESVSAKAPGTTGPPVLRTPSWRRLRTGRLDTGGRDEPKRHSLIEVSKEGANGAARGVRDSLSASYRSTPTLNLHQTDSTTDDGIRRERGQIDIDETTRTLSYESVASTLCDISSMVTAPTRQSDGSDRSTPTESLDEIRLYLRSMKSQLEIMESKCAKLEEENARLKRSFRAQGKEADQEQKPLSSANSSVHELLERVALLEGLCQDYRDENSALKRDLCDSGSSRQLEGDLKALKEKLLAADVLCEELMGENEKLKQEVFSLQQEIDEMQDQYREEEIEEFRELQRELEQTAKNCRILQFKLRKAERRNDQSESDRQLLEEKLRAMLTRDASALDPVDSRSSFAALMDISRMRDVEAELRIAKEVSVRLHGELELVEERRAKLEDENFYLKERLRETEARGKLMEQTHRFEQRRASASGLWKATGGEAEPSGIDMSGSSTSRLLRDLQDSLERETDLKEQLKFAEDDLDSTRRKVADLETENEAMMRQLAKISGAAAAASAAEQRTRGGGRPPMTRSYSEGHKQIELELAEQEAHVLKMKLNRSEQENQRLNIQMTLLEKEMDRMRSAATTTSSMETSSVSGEQQSYNSAVPDTYYKQKAKLLEQELDELRSKMDSLNAEVDQKLPHYSDTAVRMLTSLGSSTDSVDMGRKMGLIEDELKIVRERNSLLESENERLTNENRRLSIRSSPGRHGDAEHTKFTQSPEKWVQMERDMHRFIDRISELEREKELLATDLERRKRLDSIRKEESQLMTEQLRTIHVNNASVGELRERVTELLKENVVLTYELQVERRKNREIESQLDDYKEVICHTQYATTRSPAASSSATSGKAEAPLKAARQTQHPTTTTLKQLNTDLRSIADRLLADLRCGRSAAEAEKWLNAELLKFQLKLFNSVGGEGSEVQPSSPNSNNNNNSIQDQLQMVTDERNAAQKKCETATVRLLQTEDRWNKELERLKESYESQLSSLRYAVQEAEKGRSESASTVRELESMLSAKSSRVSSLEATIEQMTNEHRVKCKDMQDKADADKRRLKELEARCQSAESALDEQRRRSSLERQNAKAEWSDLKKRLDEAQSQLETAKDQANRKQAAWGRQKIELENSIKTLQAELRDFDRKAAKKAADLASAESQRLQAELEQQKRQMASERETLLQERNDADKRIADLKKQLETTVDNYERNKAELSLMKSRVSEQRQQLQDTRKQRDDFREDLNRLQQSWSREKSDLVHKLRQEEKVQQAEQQALRLKYESRIKVMEDSAKRTQSQLSIARRERDAAKDIAQTMEKKLTEMKSKYDEEQQQLRAQLEALQKENEAVENVRNQLASKRLELEQLSETVENERKLWTIEKRHLESKLSFPSSSELSNEDADKEKILTEAIAMAGKIREQMDDLKKKHDKEIQSLRDTQSARRREWNRERDALSAKLKELEDKIRISNIDYQNLLSKDEEYQTEKHSLQMERDALLTYIQDLEIRTLASKYKLDRVIEQFKYIGAKLNGLEASDEVILEATETIQMGSCQLKSIREDLARTREADRALKNLQANGGGGDRLDIMKAGSSADELSTDSPRSGRRASTDSRFMKMIFPRTASSDSNYSSSTLSRLRSPSPIPRKITNYPEAPPSIILSTDKLVEYDKDGKRHWVRRSMCRSISLEPIMSSLKNPLLPDASNTTSLIESVQSMEHRVHARSASTDTTSMCKLKYDKDVTATSRDSFETSSTGKAKERSKINKFVPFGRGRVRERRQFFEKNRETSVESSDIGHTIGSLGMQTCLVTVGGSKDVQKIIQTSSEQVEKQSSRSSSATRLLQKFRSHSTNRREAKKSLSVSRHLASDTESTWENDDDDNDEDGSGRRYGCFGSGGLRRARTKSSSIETR